MSLTTQKTQLEHDLAEKDASVMRAATALHHAATILRSENDRFWAVPTDRLLAMLNADLALTLATFQANTAAGSAINSLLDAVGQPSLPTRAPVEPGRTDIIFDGERFVYVAPPEQPPAPEESQPEPAES